MLESFVELMYVPKDFPSKFKCGKILANVCKVYTTVCSK